MITKDMAKLSPECLSLVQNTAHTLIAGTTGSGKSVLLNTILYSLLMDCEIGDGEIPLFYFIDTKRVELKAYKNLPLTLGYMTEPEDAPDFFDNIIDEMEIRYSEMEGKESADPHTYIVIDELADLIDSAEVVDSIIKIGRLGRAAHIHLLMCTQDPSRRTLTAQVMQNMTTCVALKCKSATESRQIIGVDGAEKLPAHGKAIVSTSIGLKTIHVVPTPEEDIAALNDLIIDIWLQIQEERKQAAQAERKERLISLYGDRLWKYRRLKHINPVRSRKVLSFWSCDPIR